jgi:hypothetical protein
MRPLKSVFLLYISVNIAHASTFGVPDSDTALLISIAGNTTDQLVRLEKLLSNSEKQLEYTKQLKETADALESSYDRLTSIQNSLNALSSVGSKSPEDLRAMNDKIEEIQDQRDRLKELIKVSQEAQAKSLAITDDAKTNPTRVKEVVALDQAQIKRANSSSVKNQTQETAKNTAYINSKLTETNILLRKNTETNAETNALFAKNMAQNARDEERSLKYMGVINK